MGHYASLRPLHGLQAHVQRPLRVVEGKRLFSIIQLNSCKRQRRKRMAASTIERGLEISAGDVHIPHLQIHPPELELDALPSHFEDPFINRARPRPPLPPFE